MASDESTSVPADQDNWFVGEMTVNLAVKFLTINTAAIHCFFQDSEVQYRTILHFDVFVSLTLREDNSAEHPGHLNTSIINT